MTVLFKRAATLNVHGKLLEGLHFDFRVSRTLKPEPNTADFTIYNLAPENRRFLQTQKGGVTVMLHAGYASDSKLPLIFFGQLREVTTVRDGADWVTTLSTGDGDKARKSPIGFSLGPGASFEAAVKKTVESMGLHAGNITKDIAQGKFGDASKELVEGFTSFGFGGPELDKLLDSAGLEGSIQNGELQILKKNASLNTSAVVLSDKTGLVGSPELGLDNLIRTQAKVRTLLNSEVVPGRIVHVISENLDAKFRSERVVYVGQTGGGDWYTDIEAIALGQGL